MQREMDAGSWRGKAKNEDGGKTNYKPNVTAQYREDTMRTTGQSHVDDPMILLLLLQQI